ncbi:non-lysosomal glucosylceramidase-like [Saccostrea echinata]|uniref:non-lysosomal glucosylceramidase-like n=1 Tax=Saccostrea echinata TaxID=191078 RepID=UPI002A7EBD9E|nr:non-lysosomal glucosylceramidase-like [Saccostrea echinata]
MVRITVCILETLGILDDVWVKGLRQSICSFLFQTSSSISFNMDINLPDGSYTIEVGNNTFLKSSDIFFKVDKTTYSLKDQSLKFMNRQIYSGSDQHGNYSVIKNFYLAGKANISTSFTIYEDYDAIIFTQTYHNEVKGTSSDSYDKTISGFPSFRVDSYDTALGYLSLDGFMAGDTKKHIGGWNVQTDAIGDGLQGGPLAVFDEQGRTFLISPFSRFMAASAWHDSEKGGNIFCGIMGGVDEVPANFTYSTILFYADGINKAFDGWGEFLQKQYGENEWYTWQDDTIIFLGYWSDNGGYYYFKTEPNKTYEQTMIDLINQEINVAGLNMGYIQYDSWWYYTGAGNGVKTWQPRPDVFPDGLESIDNSYAKQNGGKYDFLIEDLGGLPLQQEFWDDLFNNASKWGMFLYEQDWLNGELDRVKKLKTDLFLGELWLTQMHDAAAKQYNSIQYCMANPRHVMQAIALPWVTQVRVSEDYHPGGEQWRIGITSLFVGALGMRPFKDNFWTSKAQPEDKSGKTEPYSALNAVVSTLSMGPVGPSDRIGAINTSLLMRCCGEYGHIYKPDRPITATDLQIKKKAFTGLDMEVWWSFTKIRVNSTAIDVNWTWGVVLAVDTPTGLQLLKQDLNFMVDVVLCITRVCRQLTMASQHHSDNSITTPKNNIEGIPDFGWRVNLNYECIVKCKPFAQPRFSQVIGFIGLGIRYAKEWWKMRRLGRKMFIDHMDQLFHKAIYGAPIGGIGCGTIGRGYRGEFARFQMVPGIYDHTVIQANQFILCIRKNGKTVYQKVLTGQRESSKSLKSWEWQDPREGDVYHALYPRSWTVYNLDEFNLRLICRQVSPVYPHDYKDTSFPMATFIWTAENKGSEPLDVSIMFTFKNGRGVKDDGNGGCHNHLFDLDTEGRRVSGVSINHNIQDMKCTYCIAGVHHNDVSVTCKEYFNPRGSGQEVWDDLKDDGQLNPEGGRNTCTGKGEESAAAVCVQANVPPKQTRDLEFTLTWDMPIIHFKARENFYARRYTRWFGMDGEAGPRMSSYAAANYKTWEQKIEEWQKPVLENKNLPAWYKSALFNELYYVSDGGTVWIDPVEGQGGKLVRVTDPKDPPIVQEFSRFGYLEGHEYRMYNTYDVHHYASFSLIMLWPKLQISIQYDIAKAVESEDTTRIKFLTSGENGIRKRLHAVPHDMGDPEDEPWKRVNCYVIHPTCNWKDLNMKFVLQTFRDYSASKDEAYLKHMYPVAKYVMETAKKWDVDNDGIIDNGGFADQTFDAWTMSGASAYCGGMWLAALRMMIEMATILKKEDDVLHYKEILDKGKVSYQEKLWNGSYYNYDCSKGGHHDSVMADQLAGHWFLKASGLQDDDLFPPDRVLSSLKRIFQNNVMMFEDGNMGAINGTRPDGSKDISSCQSEEFWVGVTYGLAANMIQEGLLEEAFKTAWGAYHVCWEWYGLAFQTPEAYMTDNIYRSLGYMRPLAIWSMQWALEKFHPNLMSS